MTVMAGYPLAGAYKGKSVSDRSLLAHAVSDESIDLGRFKRDSGEAFCNRKIHMADEYSWEDGTKIDCPRCVEIVQRILAGKAP